MNLPAIHESIILELFLIKTKSRLFGLTTGVIVVVSPAQFMTTWEWLENLRGIFNGPEGTNLRFAWNPATSLFLPSDILR